MIWIIHVVFLLVRVLLDRAHTDYDNIFHGLDPEVLHPTHPPSPRPLTPPPTTTSRSPATDKFASTSETNTSDRISSSFDPSLSSPSSTDLSQILLSIKSCRWRHFRPRTLPLHELDNAHPIFRKLSRGLKRRVSASVAGGQPYQRPARAAPAPAPIAGTLSNMFLLAGRLCPSDGARSVIVMLLLLFHCTDAVMTAFTSFMLHHRMFSSYVISEMLVLLL